MEYKFRNLPKVFRDNIDPEKTKQILKNCKVAKKISKMVLLKNNMN